MRLSTILSALASCAVVSGCPFSNITTRGLYPRAQNPVYDIYDFPNGTWVEGLAVRCNGEILAGLLSSPQLVQIGPCPGCPDSSLSANVVFEPSGATSVSSITEFKDDVFAVVVGNFSIPQLASIAGSYSIWEVDMNYNPARSRIITHIPPAAWLNGITTLDSQHVLACDSTLGVVYRVDVSNGTYTQVANDTLMSPPPGVYPPLGINGIKVRNSNLYFTNSIGQSVNVMPIDSQGYPTGAATTIASGFATNDFAIDKNGDLFVTTDPQNSLIQVTPSTGSYVTVAGSANSTALEGPTAARFGRGSTDKSVIYLSTDGGVVAPVNGVVQGGKIKAVCVDTEA
ncbi:MAG: hypothetical protein M1834_008430 [Cirrosporium novae-zelandiae]|nr:MAG: hypothetical protein M1834_008430 [Cirrosporium novae-zelandiae]